MDGATGELTLSDYGRVVLQRKWVVVLAVAVCAVIAVTSVALQTPIYSAASEVLVQPRGQDGLFENQIVNLNERAIQTEIQVIEGQLVRERAQSDLDLDELPPAVNASAVGETDVISLAVRDTNASNAALYADAYATAYIDIRREQGVDELLKATGEVQTAIDELQAEVDTLDSDDPQRATLVNQLANFGTTLDQLRVDAALRTGGAVVIKAAEVPTSPIEPTPARTVTLAVVVGLLIGLGAAFLIDYLDDKVRTDDDLERLLGRPVLAVVPVDPPPDNRPLAISEPGHASVEAFRGLRTNLQFLGLDRTINVVQMTSSMAGEGKTTTASNLAVVLAQAGHRVAIVDADLRRPRIHEVFDVPQVPGLTDLLLGETPKQVVNRVDVDAVNRISVYASGRVPSNPSEMLSSQRARRLLQEMGQHYDYVIVDSAPVLPVSDSVALAGAVDGVLVIAHSGRVSEENVVETVERLERVGAPILGMVLNRATKQSPGYYQYGGYSPAQGTEVAPVRMPSNDDADDSGPVTTEV